MSETRMVGVAIAIPQPHAAILTQWRERLGDADAHKIAPHVTLLPPTTFDLDDLPVVEKHLETAAGAVGPFTMRLSGTGTFRPVSQVVFVKVGAGAAQCQTLEKAVRTDPIIRELDYPYHPHVTVAHDVDEQRLNTALAGLQDFLAQFQVRSLVLYCRDEQGSWQVQHEFPLTGI